LENENVSRNADETHAPANKQKILFMWVKGFHALRWQVRRLLNGMGRRGWRHWRVERSEKVWILFWGTHGDFMQALPGFHALEAAYPERVSAWIPDRLRMDFVPFLPSTWLGQGSLSFLDFLWAALRPVGRLYVNPPGVWRVRFDFVARFCARKAYGFRHAEEKERRAFSQTLCLDAAQNDFAKAFLKLIERSGVGPLPPFPPLAPMASQGSHAGKGVLFHIGSRGFRKSLGDEAFVDLCETLLRQMEGIPLHLRYGPGDEAVAEAIGARCTRWNPEAPALREMAGELQVFRGAVLCFDSFFAHFCRYLGRPAWVIHREKIPFGYHSGDIHRQIIMSHPQALVGELQDLWQEIHSGTETPVLMSSPNLASHNSSEEHSPVSQDPPRP
jgi:ADP-heptose:LPS heptosyltransferase